MKLKVTVNGSTYEVDVEVEEEKAQALGPIIIGGTGTQPVAQSAKAPAGEGKTLNAPISGTVLKVLVSDGQEVKSGETVVVLEAMKMETEITAPADGTVASVLVAEGEAVQGGAPVIEWA